MKKRVFDLQLLLMTCCLPLGQSASALPAICVNAGGHYLETADGKPFFWLGETASYMFR